jgi:purine catabolism regulator
VAEPADAGPSPPIELRSPLRPARTGRLTYGLPVAEVLAASSLAGARVLAGAAGLRRTVQRLHVVDAADLRAQAQPHELLLTPDRQLRGPAPALAELVAALDDRGAAGLGIACRRPGHDPPAAMLAAADRLGFPLLRLTPGVRFPDLLAHVLTDVLNRQAAQLARSEEVHRALVAIVLAGGELADVTDELVRLLGGAVFVTTPDGRVLAASGAPADLAGSLGYGDFDGSGRFRTELEPSGVHAHDGRAANHAVVPIVAGTFDHGRIVAYSPTGRLTAEDVPTLERAATVAALAITKQLAVTAVESKYRGDFLRDVVTGRAGSCEQVVAHCVSLGWDLARPVVVLVAELDPVWEAPGRSADRRPAQDRFAAAWAQVLRRRDPRAPVVGFSREVVAVVGVPPQADPERVVRDIVAEVRGDGGGGRRSFTAGVSRVVSTVAGVPAAYEQARRSVAVGRRVSGPSTVAHFDALGVFRLLSLVSDPAEVRGFVTDTLGPLARQEDPEAEDLRRTLGVLLETNLNVAETARRLHFHYNTLRYRIGKLERILGPFSRDPHLRLNVALALQAMHMRELQQPAVAADG